jgi:hypothetical protein
MEKKNGKFLSGEKIKLFSKISGRLREADLATETTTSSNGRHARPLCHGQMPQTFSAEIQTMALFIKQSIIRLFFLINGFANGSASK